MPATGKKAPPLSALVVAMRLAVLAADSMMDPSIIMLGAEAAVRPEAVWVGSGGRGELNKIIGVVHVEIISENERQKEARCNSSPGTATA